MHVFKVYIHACVFYFNLNFKPLPYGKCKNISFLPSISPVFKSITPLIGVYIVRLLINRRPYRLGRTANIRFLMSGFKKDCFQIVFVMKYMQINKKLLPLSVILKRYGHLGATFWKQLIVGMYPVTVLIYSLVIITMNLVDIFVEIKRNMSKSVIQQWWQR